MCPDFAILVNTALNNIQQPTSLGFRVKHCLTNQHLIIFGAHCLKEVTMGSVVWVRQARAYETTDQGEPSESHRGKGTKHSVFSRDYTISTAKTEHVCYAISLMKGDIRRSLDCWCVFHMWLVKADSQRVLVFHSVPFPLMLV